MWSLFLAPKGKRLDLRTTGYVVDRVLVKKTSLVDPCDAFSINAD
jgi:hypothetical protein